MGSYKLHQVKLKLFEWQVEALIFLPPSWQQKSFSRVCIATHGYTADKSSLLQWGIHLAKREIPTIIFDLPGHYLGSFNEVNEFNLFTQHVHQLFINAYHAISSLLNTTPKIILAGHSLGSYLALKASELPVLKPLCTKIIVVGYGINQGTHPLLKSFFRPLIEMRAPLVSPAIAPEKLLKWLEQEKNQVICTNQNIQFITGENDVIITPHATKQAAKLLASRNQIEMLFPRNLPHNQPELAYPHFAL